MSCLRSSHASKKLRTVPVSAHIYKMLRRDYEYDGVLELNKRLYLFMHTNPERWKNYFLISRDDQQIIKVLMPRPSQKKLYALVRGWESEFKEKLHLSVFEQTRNGINASEAIRTFLAKYDLSEEEYDQSRAYKSWQRFIKEEGKKDNIRLWA